VFKTKEYFERTGRKCFYPWVEVIVDSTLHIVLLCIKCLYYSRLDRIRDT
jgi:hypothetical protein